MAQKKRVSQHDFEHGVILERLKQLYDKHQKSFLGLFPYFLLSLSTFFLYVWSLHYPFQFDDIANISKKFAIRFDNPFSRCLTSTRWLGEWLNSVNYKIGMFDPFSYRLINVCMHIVAGIMVFVLVRRLCQSLKENAFLYNNALYVAFATASLFLLHPVQTQTVSYVIQARLEGLASLMVLSTIFCFVRMVHAQAGVQKYLFGALTFFFAFVSCGTKELVVVLPALLVLVDWFFLAQQEWDEFKKRLVFHGAFWVFFASVIIHYLGLKFVTDAVMAKVITGNNRGNVLTEGALDTIRASEFFISEFKVIVHYLWMFIWPFGISVEYDWKIEQSIFALKVVGPFLVLATLFLLALSWIKVRRMAPWAFGIFWFFIAIAPRASIIPSPELVCDYKSYLASFGMMFMLGILLVRLLHTILPALQWVYESTYARELQLIGIMVLMLPVIYSAYLRNKSWETCVAFWEDNAAKAPGKARVHNNLGVALSEVGRFDEAIASYKRAIDLDKHYSDPLSNIAVSYSLKGETDKAIESLKGAIHICPNYPEAYNNLGTLLLQKKEYDDAERALNIAIQLRPYYGKAYYNLARMHEERGDNDKAWEFLKKATEGDLDTPEVLLKLGQLGLKVKKYTESARALEKVVELGVYNEQVQFNLANAYFMCGKLERSLQIYENLVRNNPVESRYAYNLAEAYFSNNEIERAMEMFRKTTTLPNPIAQAFFRTAHCMEKLGNSDQARAYLNELLELNAPEEFKKIAKNELTRIELQTQVNENDGKRVKFSQLQKAFADINENTKGAQEGQKAGA
ncbi:MAG: tetratricopeptide repeat protein [Epsilonproteobacteria bacterium]|nr:tetratricopeptide repeat protein [Campylobacterota bacterium]